MLEYFEDAFCDANRALKLSSTPHQLWNAYEILGHYHAKYKHYKESESYFVKALESLRKSSVSNEVKAAVAGRISTVFKMVKEENKPKNRAKESAKKQEKRRQKKLDKTKKNDNVSMDEEVSGENTLPNCTPKAASVPSVSLGKSSQLECGSGALRVAVVDGRGRCVLANRDIKPGKQCLWLITLIIAKNCSGDCGAETDKIPDDQWRYRGCDAAG